MTEKIVNGREPGAWAVVEAWRKDDRRRCSYVHHPCGLWFTATSTTLFEWSDLLSPRVVRHGA